MAFPNKSLRAGDLLMTPIGEVYVYLGYYRGMPHSMYDITDCGYGYMYLFCDSWTCLSMGVRYSNDISDSAKQRIIQTGMLTPELSAKVYQNNLGRLSSSFDGNARFTKGYVQFDRLVGHVDIPANEPIIQYVYGCQRIGDKKPRGLKV